MQALASCCRYADLRNPVTPLWPRQRLRHQDGERYTAWVDGVACPLGVGDGQRTS